MKDLAQTIIILLLAVGVLGAKFYVTDTERARGLVRKFEEDEKIRTLANKLRVCQSYDYSIYQARHATVVDELAISALVARRSEARCEGKFE